ncbi:gliding motility protein GldN [Niabella beijingensis]|uniref:type IX secretion system ring protein PorN/GldN n=1 Tax=Niabella beijingensis TaxID=2872700 RepID=UPI001CBDD017|nr:gliding motility protein GldN [Niabella beijingensis]MBZ4190661.1 gliding motility protein GldN [Niabella beijingensis]
MKLKMLIAVCLMTGILTVPEYSFCQRSAYDTPISPSKKTAAPKSDTPAKEPAQSDQPDPDKSPVVDTMQADLPIEVMDEAPTGGLFGAEAKSLRKDNILEDDMSDSTATPLPYTALYASDALYRVRVWRTIDARTTKNARYFFNKAIDGEDNSRLINIMLKAIKENGVQAFSNIDDRFTTPISYDEVVASFGGGKDTAAKYDMEGNIVGYQVRSRMVSGDSVYKFRIKEEWVFNKRDGKTYIRILGLAPLSAYTTSDGYTVANSEHALFWVYYPDLRKTLVRSNIVNPLDMGGRITWEEVFENRLFDSKVIKSSLDAENGFNENPLTDAHATDIQQQLNSLSKRMWSK